MKDLFVQPDFDHSRIQVSFTPPPGCRTADYQVLEGDRVIARGRATRRGAAKKIIFEATLAGFKPWSVESPFLYRLSLILHGAGTHERVLQPFAMTKIHVQDRRIFFNNAPVFIRGVIRGREAHDHPNLAGVSTTAYYEKYIRMAKAYGFNFVRFHSRVPPPEFLEAADWLGILCQVEIRKYYGHYQKEREAVKFDHDQTLVDETEWETMLLQLRNHPCVMIYCMGNEINHPGNNERVRLISRLTQRLDPTRLFLDTTARGEYDRGTVDVEVQHMSYFAPFGVHYAMFDDSIHAAIFGSVTGKAMVEQGPGHPPAFRLRREVTLKFPLLAHEVAHYYVLRDPYRLREKCRTYGVAEPWWIGELIRMIEAKGHKSQWAVMLKASTRFQYIWIKQCLESVRKSPLLQGFQMLQLADTDRYENANGLLDFFDDPKEIPAKAIQAFNADTVLVADLPRRVFAEKTTFSIPILVSQFAPEGFDSGTLRWSLKSKKGKRIAFGGAMDRMDLAQRGNYKIARLEISLPALKKPEALVLALELISGDGKRKTSNAWDLWAFPNRPERVSALSATVALKQVNLSQRYPQITCKNNLNRTERVLITDTFNEKVLEHLRRGRDALILYRISENRDRQAPRESYYLPSTWERFKGIIWDRGHNAGGFLRDHPVADAFPHERFLDWQFYALVEDGDKIDLDDFPAPLESIIEGVDKAARDRFDVGRFNLSEFQYAYTLRKFAYLFELRVGKGRLIVSGFNFKGLETEEPATCWLFETLLGYMRSVRFRPKAALSVEAFRDYLLEKGQAPRIKERMMTQYWQLDDAPLESKRYWEESEAWLRKQD